MARDASTDAATHAPGDAPGDVPGDVQLDYRAAPQSGSGPGVLVLPDGPRVDALARTACERLARAGFVALATPVAAADGAERLARAVRVLLSDAATRSARIGVLGFGRGGVAGLSLAGREPHIAAVVSVEGVPSDATADALPPTLLIYGAGDGAVVTAATAFAAAAPAVRLHAEPEAAAGFFDEGRPDRHVALAAVRAWDAALAFLRAAG